jgi:hypothetical protein
VSLDCCEPQGRDGANVKSSGNYDVPPTASQQRSRKRGETSMLSPSLRLPRITAKLEAISILIGVLGTVKIQILSPFPPFVTIKPTIDAQATDLLLASFPHSPGHENSNRLNTFCLPTRKLRRNSTLPQSAAVAIRFIHVDHCFSAFSPDPRTDSALMDGS